MCQPFMLDADSRIGGSLGIIHSFVNNFFVRDALP